MYQKKVNAVNYLSTWDNIVIVLGTNLNPFFRTEILPSLVYLPRKATRIVIHGKSLKLQ